MLNQEVINKLFALYKDDSEMLDFMVNWLFSFQEYYKSIYEMEIKLKAYPAEVIGTAEYQAMVTQLDKARTVKHNAILANVRALNRLAEKAGFEPVYDGVVSEERPYRRQVANAVFEYMDEILKNRR